MNLTKILFPQLLHGKTKEQYETTVGFRDDIERGAAFIPNAEQLETAQALSKEYSSRMEGDLLRTKLGFVGTIASSISLPVEQSYMFINSLLLPHISPSLIPMDSETIVFGGILSYFLASGFSALSNEYRSAQAVDLIDVSKYKGNQLEKARESRRTLSPGHYY